MAEISIIIPLYNKEKHIKATLKSVLEQTFQDFEIIIVNDGSIDGSVEEIRTLTDDRIKVFTIDNHGVSHARNYGVAKANAELIAFLDADDVWKPHHLENLKQLREKFPDCGMYATAYELIYYTKIIDSEYHNIPKATEWSGVVADFFSSSYINCIVHSSAVMIPKTIFKSIGGFNSHYDSGEDIDFWIRIALKHPTVFINNVSVSINMNAENKISQRSIHSKTHMDFDAFQNEEIKNSSLKKYLDLNRFSMAIQYKLEGYEHEAKDYIEKLDPKNLNKKQRFLLQLNGRTLRLLMKFKTFLRNNGIGLSAFR